MSIKSDKWIRRMANEHGMIEPFESGQVRENGAGRIVSYGTSSYGYDIRCSDEFKIFTNINSAIVDPKNFDDNSFVDVKSDVCIIPPNSFALARTVEYFRIPRNVLTICLGKSTYARCARHCPRRSTPTRVWPRCCSWNPMKSARRPTRTAAASTRASRVSPCRRPEHQPH
jgi:deoxycytidine triphosphate deaminase